MSFTYLFSDLILARVKSEGMSIVIIVLLLVGLGAGVYLTQQSQSVRSRADVVFEAFVVTDTEDKPLVYRGNNIYKTNSLKIRIRLKDASLLLD